MKIDWEKVWQKYDPDVSDVQELVDEIERQIADQEHTAYAEGYRDGQKQMRERAEKCAHRNEPYELGEKQTYGYLSACEDIIVAICALEIEEPEDSKNV